MGRVQASLKHRVIEPEILDTLPLDEARASLRDLMRLNRYFGGRTALAALLRSAGLHPADRFTVLDVGAASGDMGREMRIRYPNATVVSLDHIPSHLETADFPKVAADAFHLPFARQAFDFVFSSLFLHHFDDDDVVRLLRSFGVIARRGVLVVDLERQWIPYWFVPATRPLFGWDAVTSHDARKSVAAAFRPPELAALAARAGFPRADVRTHGLAYRITMFATGLWDCC
jgi:SAM-dependent methyltransferase